jgi:hypothetical protein
MPSNNRPSPGWIALTEAATYLRDRYPDAAVHPGYKIILRRAYDGDFRSRILGKQRIIEAEEVPRFERCFYPAGP